MVVQNELMKDVSMRYATSNNIKLNTSDMKNYSQAPKQEPDIKQTEPIVKVSLSDRAKKASADDYNLKSSVEDTQEQITKNQSTDLSLAQINEKFYKITQLYIQAKDEEATPSDIQKIQEEINKLRMEIRGLDSTASFNNIGTAMAQRNQETADTSEETQAYEMSQNVEGVYEEAVTRAPQRAITGQDIARYIEHIDLNTNIDLSTIEGIDKAIEQTTAASSYIEQARMYLSAENSRLEDVVTTQNNLDRYMQGSRTTDAAEGGYDAVNNLLNDGSIISRANTKMTESPAQALATQNSLSADAVMALLS